MTLEKAREKALITIAKKGLPICGYSDEPLKVGSIQPWQFVIENETHPVLIVKELTRNEYIEWRDSVGFKPYELDEEAKYFYEVSLD